MSDYQRIADEVRSFIEATDQTRDTSLDALAEAYAIACKEVNARLRRCGDLLHRGLRSEALHLAQEQPDLLDSVAVLDVPQIEVWEETCAMHGLPRPMRLMMEVAAELNDAYGAEEPLQASLSELRLLAIARAPVHMRLRVTRRLRSLDPDTPHWTEDAAALERAVLAGVKQDVAAALKLADPHVIRRLLDDLTSPDWINPPPKALVEPLVEAELNSLVSQVADAQRSGDVVRVRRGLAGVQKALAARKVALPGKHVGVVGSANAWLTRQDESAAEQAEFDELCATMKAEIANDAPWSHVEAIWARVQTWGLPVPDDVLDAFERAKFRRKAVGKRAVVQYAAIAILILGCLVAGAWAFLSKHRDDTSARQWIAQVDRAIAQYDFEPATQTWSILGAKSPKVAARDDVVAAHVRLEAAASAERRRLMSFDAAMRDAADASLPMARRVSQVTAAQGLARSEGERSRVNELRHQLATSAASAPTPVPATPTPSLPGSDPSPSKEPTAVPQVETPAPETKLG